MYIHFQVHAYVCMHAWMCYTYVCILFIVSHVHIDAQLRRIGRFAGVAKHGGWQQEELACEEYKNKSMMARFRLQATRIDRHVSVAEDDDVAYFARASILFRAFPFYRGCFPALAVGQYLFTTVY